jgi:Holliday junction DNA helicase RuvA
MDLYGFLDYKELEFFEILDSIRGVGPKAALEISSLGSLEDIKDKILAKENIFESIPGIGKKKAMTIILELTGRIKDLPKEKKTIPVDEAEEGLISLGFSREKAKQALVKVPEDIKNPEERIKQALRVLGK